MNQVTDGKEQEEGEAGLQVLGRAGSRLQELQMHDDEQGAGDGDAEAVDDDEEHRGGIGQRSPLLERASTLRVHEDFALDKVLQVFSGFGAAPNRVNQLKH